MKLGQGRLCYGCEGLANKYLGRAFTADLGSLETYNSRVGKFPELTVNKNN